MEGRVLARGRARWFFAGHLVVTAASLLLLLALGALDGMSAPLCYIIPAVLLISALLTAAYLFPPLCRAFFPGQDFPARSRVREPLLLVLSLALFAAASLILGLLSGITVPVMEHITGSIL